MFNRGLSVKSLRFTAAVVAFGIWLLGGCAVNPSVTPSPPSPETPPAPSTPVEVPPDKELGRAFVTEALRQFKFVKDPEITRLVHRVGRQLVDTTGSNPEGYHFLVVRESQLNAFAIPGGYIFLFEGLLGQISSVEEMAGVLAHEIAHVQKNHFFKDQKKIMAMDLATIAAILLAGPEAAVLAQGASINMRLQYSRQNEEEADATGLIYLRRAGYNPEGLLRFFETLASYEQFNPPILPSYFSTHPGVQERLRTVSVLLRGLKPEELHNHPRQTQESLDWERILVILRSTSGNTGRSEEDMKVLVRRIIGERGSPERAHYLLGVAYLKTDRITQAIPEYQEALKLDPDNGTYHAELAYCYLRLKKMDLAKAEVQKALELSGQNSLAQLVSGMIQTGDGDLEGALGSFQQALAIAPDDPQVHWNLAQVYLKKGDRLMGAFHLGLYARLSLEPDKALEQLRHAEKLAQEGSDVALRIQKQVDEILREGL